MSFEWISYQGKQILVGHFTGLSDEDRLIAIDEVKCEILEHRDRPHSVLFMSCSDSSINDRTSQKWKELNSQTDGIVKGVAIVGVGFFVRAIAKLINRDLYFASSEQDALDWLAKR